MKAILTALLALALVSCSTEDGAKLKSENDALKAQLEQVTRERDQFKSQIDRVRAALDGTLAPSVTTPGATPDSSTTPPETTPANPVAPSGSDMGATPSTPSTSSPDSLNPVIPDSNTPAPSTSSPAPTNPDFSSPGPTLPPATNNASSLESLTDYANQVLSAAQNFKAQTKQEAPIACANGYVAGEYRVQDIIDLRDCKVTLEPNGEYRVQAKDASGNSVSLP